VLLNVNSFDGGGEGFRGVWAGPQGEGAKDKLLVFDEVAAGNRAGAAGLKTRPATFVDTLQAASMWFQSHVSCCNWHRRQEKALSSHESSIAASKS